MCVCVPILLLHILFNLKEFIYSLVSREKMGFVFIFASLTKMCIYLKIDTVHLITLNLYSDLN